MNPSFKRTLRKLFAPRYDELSLYLMSLAFIFVFFTDPGLRSGSLNFLFSEFNVRMYMLVLLYIGGLFYSLYHVFSRRPRCDFEKTMMLMFAVVTNGVSGIAAGIHILKETSGLLIIFPVWNIASGGLLLAMWYYDIINETSVADENASPTEVLLGTIALAVALVICRFALSLYWAVTFSICVAYATHLSRPFQSLTSYLGWTHDRA